MSAKNVYCTFLPIVVCALLVSALWGCSSGSSSSSADPKSPSGATMVTVSPATATVQVSSGTQPFTATVTTNQQNQNVTWTLSGSGCSAATCGTLSATTSASGTAITYTAPSALPNPPTVTLTATSSASSTSMAQAVITLTAVPSTTVSLSPTTASLQAPGGAQQFTATVTTNQQNQNVTWTLSGSGCNAATCGTLSATSSASGVPITYTAPPAVPNPAMVTLTATSDASSASTAQATITLSAPVPTNISVSISPKQAGIASGQSLPLTATLQNDTTNSGVTWSASSSSCSASACGTFTAGTSTTAAYVAPAAGGVYTITATSVVDVTKSASITVGVTDLPGVLTFHNNLSRDGTNTHEFVLTTSNVTTATFGKLFSCQADGAIYTQPLWIPQRSVGGAPHNVIVVATQHDSLYAFDADASPCATLWHVNLLDSAHGGSASETTVPAGSTGFFVGEGAGDITPEVGVTGTPVIDQSSNTLYVVSKSVIPAGTPAASTFYQRLHAIDITTGMEKTGSPVTITGTTPGTGDGGTMVTFRARQQNQRPGLALVNGVVYVAWASHEDVPTYYGWIMGFNASTLAQTALLNVTPNVGYGGIWMGGGAPAADSSDNLYLITGNGAFDKTSPSAPNNDYGDSFLKLTSGLTVSQYFTPTDYMTDQANDQDFGAGGAALLVDQPNGPVLHLVIGGGKDGYLYLLNRDSMGGLGDANAWQRFKFGSGIFATGAFWNNTFYMAGVGGHLQAVPFNSSTGMFNTGNVSQSAASFGFPGSTPSVSASGTTNGIVWALDQGNYCTPGDHPHGCGPVVLHAYDATNLAIELWNSTMGTGNAAGNAVKFTVPTVANGKVYVGTRGNNTGGVGSSTSSPGELDVYGLLPN